MEQWCQLCKGMSYHPGMADSRLDWVDCCQSVINSSVLLDVQRPASILLNPAHLSYVFII